MNYDLLNELATDNTRIGVIKGDYEALESRAQYAEAALEVLKAKVREYLVLVQAQLMEPHNNDRKIERSKAELGLWELCK